MDLQEVHIQFSESQITILNFCLAYIMFGVALELTLKDFAYVLNHKKSTLVGLFSQLVILPLLTLCLIWIIKPVPGLALGMLLISVCPGGNVSNYAVYLARGNVALSVVLTSISTITSSFQTPFTFALLLYLLPKGMGTDFKEFSIPFVDMVTTVFTLMVIPLIAGMYFGTRYPDLKVKILPWVKRSSLLLFSGIVVSGIFNNISQIQDYLHQVFYIVMMHNGLALLTGYILAMLFTLPKGDARSISIETGIQNSGLALVLIFNFFDGMGSMALIAAWWSIWHLISALSLSLFWNYKDKKENVAA